MSKPQASLRPARVTDARAILELVNTLAKDQVMLPRSPASVVENIRSFVVAEVSSPAADGSPGEPSSRAAAPSRSSGRTSPRCARSRSTRASRASASVGSWPST